MSDRTRKPKKGVVVPSRYKQAAEGFSSQSSKEKSSQDTTYKYKSNITQRMDSTISSSTSQSRKNEIFASTPAIQGRNILPSMDTTLIEGLSSVTNRDVGLDSTRVGAVPKKKEHKIQNQTAKGMSSKLPSRKPCYEVLDAETENHLLYAEYLQAKLLESNAKEALQDRSKDALDKIHQIWCLMQDLVVKNEAAYRDLQITSHLVNLHQHLCKQEEVLVPALEVMSVIEKEYGSIAQAINTVKHNLETKDILLPYSSDEVAALVKKVEELILTAKEKYDFEIVNSAALATDNQARQGKLVAEEIKRNSKLLSEAKELLLCESILKLGT